jgi:hypothetical protein
MTYLKKPGEIIMNGINRLVGITVVFMTVLNATLCFAQEDHVSVKRIIGDFYEITISGERNGDFAEVRQVRIEKSNILYDNTTLAGYHPSMSISALVASGGDENARSTYTWTFQEELPFFVYSINYFVTDNYDDLANAERVDGLTLDNYDRMYDSHHDDGYYFAVDLTGSSFEPQPEGTLTIHNLKVEGVEDPLWATFQWNPGSLKFELKGAGSEK